MFAMLYENWQKRKTKITPKGKTNTKTFASFWLLHSPVEGNFILIWVDGKSAKVITAFRRSLTRCETRHPLLYSSLKARQRDGCLLFVPREYGDLQAVTTPTTASPRHLPSALWEVLSTGEKLHSAKKVKMPTKTHSCFSWRDTCDSRKADQLACWVLSRPLPLQNVKLIFFKPAFHYQCSHTPQNNLFTKTYINKQFWLFKNESTQKKQEQRRLLLLCCSWKGA